MPQLPKMRLILALATLLATMMPALLVAQDDPNDLPLGDVARTLRKKTPLSQNVIDDDNLPKMMAEAESRHAAGSALKFLKTGEDNGFKVAAPDVTCSLSFSAGAKSLLSGAYAQMELPPGEVQKLEGPATIEGDALLVSVYNRTDWHVSEVAVALTVVSKTHKGSLSDDSSGESEVRPEKKPDTTVIYRMRAAAPPSATTVFSAPLNLDFAPDEEWHWAIVQARGYPPQSYAGNAPQTTPQGNGAVSSQFTQDQTRSGEPTLVQPTLLPASAKPQYPPALSIPQDSH
jgi:hypothetical protein